MSRRKRNRQAAPSRWQAVPNDAIRLAALRWFALTIEKEAIELYATNTATFPEMEKILRKALGEIDDLRDKFAAGRWRLPGGLHPVRRRRLQAVVRQDRPATRRSGSVLNEQGAGVLHQFLDPDEEPDGLGAIHDAVVVRERDVHHRPQHDLAVHGRRPFLDRVQARGCRPAADSRSACSSVTRRRRRS